jgi:hypothetical protein
MKALLDLFKQVQPNEQFDAIKIGLASPEKSVPGPTAKLKSRKPSTTVLSSLSATVCSAPKFLARSKITNACAVNTSV